MMTLFFISSRLKYLEKIPPISWVRQSGRSGEAESFMSKFFISNLKSYFDTLFRNISIVFSMLYFKKNNVV